MLFAVLFAAGARWPALLLVTAMGVASLPVVWKAMTAEQRSRVTVLFQQSMASRAVATTINFTRQADAGLWRDLGQRAERSSRARPGCLSPSGVSQ